MNLEWHYFASGLVAHLVDVRFDGSTSAAAAVCGTAPVSGYCWLLSGGRRRRCKRCLTFAARPVKIPT